MKTKYTRIILYSKEPYPLHYAAETGDCKAFRELLYAPEDVQILDSCCRNIFHVISERGDEKFLNHVLRVFTGNNRINANDNIVCDREKYKILENTLNAKATYKVRYYAFACVQTGKRKRTGNAITCQVPCYLNSIEKVRTPVDVALYRYDYTLLEKYAKIPCARSIIYERVRPHLQKMVSKRTGRSIPETNQYKNDLLGILRVMKSLSRDSSIRVDIQRILSEMQTSKVIQKMPQTTEKFKAFDVAGALNRVANTVETPNIQNRR